MERNCGGRSLESHPYWLGLDDFGGANHTYRRVSVGASAAEQETKIHGTEACRCLDQQLKDEV